MPFTKVTLLRQTFARTSQWSHWYKMAPTKKSSSGSKTRSSGSQISLQKVKGENFYRNAKQVKRLKMLSGGNAVRDRDGKIIQAAAFQKGEDETTPGRVQPDRRGVWASVLCLTNPATYLHLIFFPRKLPAISHTYLVHSLP